MSFFVNCGWCPVEWGEIQIRIGDIVRLLEREETVALVGPNWYRKGRSKKEALSKPVSLAKLGELRSWAREKFPHVEGGREVVAIEYWLDVWNGLDSPAGASFSARLHKSATGVDTLVFAGPDLESLKDKWPQALAWGEAVAQHLGGKSLVSSDHIIDWATAEGVEQATWAGYAAFDGKDGRSVVGAATWAEAIAPDKQRVQEFIRTYRAMFGD